MKVSIGSLLSSCAVEAPDIFWTEQLQFDIACCVTNEMVKLNQNLNSKIITFVSSNLNFCCRCSSQC